jgi:hypothetical protein
MTKPRTGQAPDFMSREEFARGSAAAGPGFADPD